ncbi:MULTISPECIES: hypothetical protein [Bacteria]|uniref:hypothetical protein n=1 Tax=Bacteria TaxID=2 RepID=UPI003C7C1794
MTATISIAAIFDLPLGGVAPLELEAELSLIDRAQHGDNDAKNDLLMQYAPALRALVAREVTRSGGNVTSDEARANVLLAFWETVASCDGTERVARRLGHQAQETEHEYGLHPGLSVPARTRRKFYQARREAGAGGDVMAAARALGMADETIHAVRAAIDADSFEGHVAHISTASPGSDISLSGGSLTGGAGWDTQITGLTEERGYATVEDAATCAIAFTAVDSVRGGIIRDAYGFTDLDPLPDSEIAHRRGMTRSKVQRLRSEGIAAMRAALGAEEADR